MTDREAAGGVIREQRAAPRASLKKCATLATANGVAMDVRTADISLGGMGVIADSPLVPGQSCMVQIESCVDNQKKQMLMRGTVAFCLFIATEGFRIGIRANQFDPDLIQFIQRLFQ